MDGRVDGWIDGRVDGQVQQKQNVVAKASIVCNKRIFGAHLLLFIQRPLHLYT